MKTHYMLNALAGTTLILASFNASARHGLIQEYNDELDDWVVTALAGEDMEKAVFNALETISIGESADRFQPESDSVESAYLDQ